MRDQETAQEACASRRTALPLLPDGCNHSPRPIYVDFKDLKVLRLMIDREGHIQSRRRTGNCADLTRGPAGCYVRGSGVAPLRAGRINRSAPKSQRCCERNRALSIPTVRAINFGPGPTCRAHVAASEFAVFGRSSNQLPIQSHNLPIKLRACPPGVNLIERFVRGEE